MDEEFPAEVIRRSEYLDALREGPQSARALERRLPASRSTIHRVTKQFVEVGVVRQTEEGVELTGTGRALAREAVRFRERIRTTRRLDALFDVPGGDVPAELPIEDLADARVVEPDRRDAHRVTDAIIDRLRRSSSIRLVSSAASPVFLDALYDRAVGGAAVDAVMHPEAVEVLFSRYGETAREAVRSGEFAVRIGDGLPFELFVFDDAVGLAPIDDEGVLQAFVTSEDDGVVEWGRSLFEQRREASEYATLF